jgi:hypothetical protein
VSVSVALSEVAERIEELGPVAYLLSVGADDRPHLVSVRVDWRGDELVAGAGKTTSANVADRPHVTLLWAAPPGEAYCLIVDGSARSIDDALAITPTTAVLHRTPEGDSSSPSCIRLLEREG